MSQRSFLLLGFCVYAVASLVSMAAMSLGAVFLAACLIVGSGGIAPFLRAVKHELVGPGKGYLAVSVLLAGACLLSLVVAYFDPLSYGGLSSQVHILKDMQKAWYLFWPLILVVGLKQLSKQDRGIVLATWLVAFVLLSALGIFQHYYHGWPRPQEIPSNIGYFHVTLLLGHHLAVASIFTFPVFAIMDFVLDTFRAKGVIRLGRFSGTRLFLIHCGIFALVLGFTALIFTYSRTLWITLPIGVLVWILLVLPKKWAFLFAGVCVATGLVLVQAPFIQQRIKDSYGLETRQHVWKVHLDFVRHRPWTGVGWNHNVELVRIYNQIMETEPSPDGYYFVGHAHNNLLEMLAATGVVGAAAWLLWCGWLFSSLWKVRKTRIYPRFAVGMLSAWVVFHLNGLTQVNFWDSKVLHIMMLMVAWVLLWRESERKVV